MVIEKKARKWKESPQELIDLFDDVMDCYVEAQKKKMFGYPCCFLGNNLFTGLHQTDWILRLDENDRNEIASKFNAKGFEPMGRRMKQYVLLPQSVIDDTDELHAWLMKSIAYTKTLPRKKPKPKKKKSK